MLAKPRNTKWQSGTVINIVSRWNPTRHYLTFIHSHHWYLKLHIPLVN